MKEFTSIIEIYGFFKSTNSRIFNNTRYENLKKRYQNNKRYLTSDVPIDYDKINS